MRTFGLKVNNEVFTAIFDELFDDFQIWFNIHSKLWINFILFIYHDANFRLIQYFQSKLSLHHNEWFLKVFKQVTFTE